VADVAAQVTSNFKTLFAGGGSHSNVTA